MRGYIQGDRALVVDGRVEGEGERFARLDVDHGGLGSGGTSDVTTEIGRGKICDLRQRGRGLQGSSPKTAKGLSLPVTGWFWLVFCRIPS